MRHHLQITRRRGCGAWCAVVELASEELGSAGHGDTQFSFDTGLVWLVTDNLQLDTAAYAGLNRSTPDITIAIGLSARW